MEKKIQDYLLHRSLGLNGQIRGAINKKAREENLDLIMITVRTIFEEAYSLGKSVKEQEETLDKLKKDLDIKPKENGKSRDSDI